MQSQNNNNKIYVEKTEMDALSEKSHLQKRFQKNDAAAQHPAAGPSLPQP
jgi:hypothetical protein